MKTYSFHISGTHCPSCKLFVEEKLKGQSFLTDARVDLKKKSLEIDTIENFMPDEFAKILTKHIQSNGYTVSVQKIEQKNNNDDLIWKALPIGLGFLILFFLLQKSGILNIGIGGQISPLTSFIIGLIASVSSCLAIVGGLVLSLSAKISQDKKSDTKTFFLFHTGRLLTFAILGGVLGAVGAFVGVNFTLTAIMGLLASLVMLILGLNLVGVLERNTITMPLSVFSFLKRIEHKAFAPIALGFATFFLPCGFTQSMQISALSTGSFLSGLFIMFAFALGTLPVLVLLSFGSASFAQGKHASLFFKTAGVVVIGLGLFALLSGLAGLGIINPLFNI